MVLVPMSPLRPLRDICVNTDIFHTQENMFTILSRLKEINKGVIRLFSYLDRGTCCKTQFRLCHKDNSHHMWHISELCVNGTSVPNHSFCYMKSTSSNYSPCSFLRSTVAFVAFSILLFGPPLLPLQEQKEPRKTKVILTSLL